MNSDLAAQSLGPAPALAAPPGSSLDVQRLKPELRPTRAEPEFRKDPDNSHARGEQGTLVCMT